MIKRFVKYRLSDDKITQDIVSTFLVFAGLLWSLGLDVDVPEINPDTETVENDAEGRHSRPIDDRSERAAMR
jgi:hypothetical protein